MDDLRKAAAEKPRVLMRDGDLVVMAPSCQRCGCAVLLADHEKQATVCFYGHVVLQW